MRLLRRAAQGPDAALRGKANFHLAHRHEMGERGVTKHDWHVALAYFEKALADGHPHAALRIRRLEYFPDIYIKRRQEEFVPPPREMRSPGSLKLAEDLYFQGKYAEALPLLLHHAKLGSADAQYRLAMMYALGEGVDPDKHRCRAWCYLAAKSGHPEAESALGQELFHDHSIFHTGDEIERWLKRAAERKDPDAIMALGLLLIHPRRYGNIFDVPRAMRMLKEAASLGSTEAMVHLGDFYAGYKSRLLDKTNPDYAKKWYLAAAKAGDAKACDRLRKVFKIKYDGADSAKAKTSAAKKPRGKRRT